MFACAHVCLCMYVCGLETGGTYRRINAVLWS